MVCRCAARQHALAARLGGAAGGHAHARRRPGPVRLAGVGADVGAPPRWPPVIRPCAQRRLFFNANAALFWRECGAWHPTPTTGAGSNAGAWPSLAAQAPGRSGWPELLHPPPLRPALLTRRSAARQAVMTDDYQGITLLLLNRSGDGGGQMQTINFAGYSGNTADGAQWLFAARPHSGWGADPAPCGSVVVRAWPAALYGARGFACPPGRLSKCWVPRAPAGPSALSRRPPDPPAAGARRL